MHERINFRNFPDKMLRPGALPGWLEANDLSAIHLAPVLAVFPQDGAAKVNGPLATSRREEANSMYVLMNAQGQ